MQSRILEVMRGSYEYNPAPNGIGYGLACMASQAVIRKDAASFYTRIIKIKENNEFENTIKTFFGGVTLYSGSPSLTPEHMRALRLPFRQEISAPAQLMSFEPHAGRIPDCELIPVVVHRLIAIFSKSSMRNYLDLLQSHCKKTPFSLVINYPTHTVQIGFDGLRWLSVNHDDTVYKDDEGFVKVLDNVLKGIPPYGDCWCASIEIVREKPDKNLAEIPNPIQANEQEFVSLADAQKQQCIYLALQNGHHETVRKFIDILNRQMRNRLLWTDELAKSSLIHKLIELLAAKNEQGAPGLFMALQNGHSEAVKAFMEMLAGMRLEGILQDRMLIELLTASFNGMSGLFMAMENGHSEAVKTFIEMLISMWQKKILQENELTKLIRAEDAHGIPGMALALKAGHREVVKVFMELLADIRKKKILPKKTVTGLAAANFKEMPWLLMALEKGLWEAVQMFMEVLADMRQKEILSEEEFYELAAVKDHKGRVQGLLPALKNGHTKTVKAVMRVLAGMLEEETLPETVLVELVAAKRADGVSGISLAVQKGHIDTVLAVTQMSGNMRKKGSLSKTAYLKMTA